MQVQSFGLPSITLDSNNVANPPQIIKIATGDRGNVHIKNPNSPADNGFAFYIGGPDLLTEEYPTRIAYPLNNNDEVVVYLEKDEEIYAFCNDQNGNSVVVMFE